MDGLLELSDVGVLSHRNPHDLLEGASYLRVVHERCGDLRTLLVTAAMKAHDANGDNKLQKEEHLAFHKRRHGSASRPPRALTSSP